MERENHELVAVLTWRFPGFLHARIFRYFRSAGREKKKTNCVETYNIIHSLQDQMSPILLQINLQLRTDPP